MLYHLVSEPPMFFAVRSNLTDTQGNILSSCHDIYALHSVTFLQRWNTESQLRDSVYRRSSCFVLPSCFSLLAWEKKASALHQA